MINIRKILPWLLVILWMSLIFYLSHQPVAKSNKLSKGRTENAHFFAYLILGLLVVNGLRSSGILGFKNMGLAILLCLLYAISDEVHQLFVPGRGGQVKDVLIDSAGSISGIVMYNIRKIIS